MGYAACTGLPTFVLAPAKLRRISSARSGPSNACARRSAKESLSALKLSFANGPSLLPKQLLHSAISFRISSACGVILQAFSFVVHGLLD